MSIIFSNNGVASRGLARRFSLAMMVGAIILLNAKLAYGAIHGSIAGSGVAYEESLMNSVRMLQEGDLSGALELTESHLARFPKSQVGHLIQADVLNAMSAATPQIGPQAAQKTKQLIGLKHQIRNRWLHDQVQHEVASKMVPANLVMIGRHKYVLVADLQFGRLYLYENKEGLPRLVRDYYLSVGKAGFGKQIEGDNKTPVGLYSIIKHIEGVKLPDLYGKGAFPVDYPNRYDKSLKRTGYGIWLHGTPSDTYARAPWSSEGCFVLSNDDLLDIQQYLDVQARPPVILSDSIEWIDLHELDNRRHGYLSLIENWKRDWESLNVEAYLGHYSQDNTNLGSVSYDQWAKKKVRQNESKSFIQVVLDVDSLFVYPGEDDMFVVKFKQHYLSNDVVKEEDVEQYWKLDSRGQWKIIYEG